MEGKELKTGVGHKENTKKVHITRRIQEEYAPMIRLHAGYLNCERQLEVYRTSQSSVVLVMRILKRQLFRRLRGHGIGYLFRLDHRVRE